MDLEKAAMNLRSVVEPQMTVEELLKKRLQQQGILPLAQSPGAVGNQKRKMTKEEVIKDFVNDQMIPLKINALQGLQDETRDTANLIDQLRAKPKPSGMNPISWGLLADTFAPQGTQTNNLSVARALYQPEDVDKKIYDFKGQLGDQYLKLAKQASLMDGSEYSEMDLEKLRQKHRKEMLRLKGNRPRQSEYNKVLAREMAKDTADFMTKLPKVQSDIDSLYSIANDLENVDKTGDNLTGNLKIPDWDILGGLGGKDTGIPLGTPGIKQLRGLTNKESVDKEDEIRRIVSETLTQTLGSQFTKAEGEKIVAASYNLNLDEKINAQRVKRLARQLERAAALRIELHEHLKRNPDLSNYKLPSIIVDKGQGEGEIDLSTYIAADLLGSGGLDPTTPAKNMLIEQKKKTDAKEELRKKLNLK